MNVIKETGIDIPNLLLIAGNGRNVGKTWLACRIIEKLSQNQKITAIKISSHFHPIDADSVIIQNERYIICLEKSINCKKDSSLMLQAGAGKVYFIMASPQHLHEAFLFLLNNIKNQLIICESGGLSEFVNPGIFLFVIKDGSEIQKPHLLAHSPYIIKNIDNKIDFDINRISVSEGKFILEK